MNNFDDASFNSLPSKISVVLLVTSQCMLDCFHCYNYDKERNLSLDQHLKILENLYKIGVYRAVFSGGECLLLKHITELLRHSAKNNVNNSVSTNGILLNPSKFAEIKPYTSSIDISLNSLKEETNRKMIKNYFAGYETMILKRIDMVSNSEVPLNVNVLVSKTNVDDIAGVMKVLQDKNINAVKLFEHSPIRGRAAGIHSEINISGADFHKQCDELAQAFPTINFLKRTTKRLVESYLRISHTGDFELYKGHGGTIGNPITGPEITRADIEKALQNRQK